MAKRFTCFLVAVALISGCGLTLGKQFKISAQQAERNGQPPLSFRFDYSDLFKPAVNGSMGRNIYVTLLAGRQRAVRQWLQVSFLSTHGQDRDSAAYLPILMEEWKRRLANTMPEYRFIQEGLTKVGDGLRAYQLFFTCGGLPEESGQSSQQMMGRLILVPRPGLSNGVAMIFLAGRSAGLKRSTEVALEGPGSEVVSSFRFG